MQVKHIKADRKDYAGLKDKLAGHKFDAVYDINAREAEEVQAVLDACPGIQQYIFCSSAGERQLGEEPCLPRGRMGRAPTDPRASDIWLQVST